MIEKAFLSIEKRNIFILNLILFPLSCVPFFLTHEQAIQYSAFNYFLLQMIAFSMVFSVRKENRNTFLLSPSFIAVSYVNINFFIGSIVFPKGLVFDFVLLPYREWRNVNLSMLYFNLANFFIINTFFLSRTIKSLNIKPLFDISKAGKLKTVLIGLVCIFTFSTVQLDLSLLGGQGSFSIIPKSLGAILIFLTFYRNYSLKVRIACYAFMIFLFALSAFEDKRDAIFLLLPIVLLESRRYLFKIGLKRIVLLTLVSTFLGYLIIVMSILRGYGEYKAKGFLDATNYVNDYIRSDIFIPAFMNNLEISFTYFHSNNAIEHILNDPSKLSYGMTIIKPFFIPFPRRIFPKKPDSIIELYTSSFSEMMRRSGVSWVICIQSEMFWNFHFAGIFGCAFLFFFLNCIYRNLIQLIDLDKIINHIPLLYLYQQMLVLFRGSGLDQYFIDIILSFLIFAFIKLIIVGFHIKPRKYSNENIPQD